MNTRREPLLLTFLLLAFLLAAGHPSQAQLFPDKLIGQWEGMMHISKDGVARDSVRIRLTIANGQSSGTWMWKTEYLSEKLPMVKDYVLRLVDSGKQTYITDEGGGIELRDYLFGNKLYCVFETHEVLLTSSYELLGKELIFEVTSGKRLPPGGEVFNYSVSNLQRAVLKLVR